MLEHEPEQYHSDVENGADRPWVATRGQRGGRSLSERKQAEPPGHRKPALVRSKTFDPSMLSDPECKIDRKKYHYSQLSKTNSQYHKIFKDISKEEQLRQSYTCALQKDILYQGRLFVSDSWVCFQSKVFGKDTKIVIPVVAITHIKKTKTAILVPNALLIATATDRHLFVSFMSRDNTYKYLMSVCLHLEEKSPCSSPIPSSQSSFRGQRSPPLGDHGDLSDVEGPLSREESSSSDSQTPGYDTGLPMPPFLDVLKPGEPSLEPPDGLEPSLEPPEPPEPQPCPGSTQAADKRTIKHVSLNTLLLVYLLLVCVLVMSSCYLALRIFSLEQRLSALGTLSDLEPGEFLGGDHGEMYSELTLNLIRLEKVQRNLQRLMEEVA